MGVCVYRPVKREGLEPCPVRVHWFEPPSRTKYRIRVVSAVHSFEGNENDAHGPSEAESERRC